MDPESLSTTLTEETPQQQGTPNPNLGTTAKPAEGKKGLNVPRLVRADEKAAKPAGKQPTPARTGGKQPEAPAPQTPSQDDFFSALEKELANPVVPKGLSNGEADPAQDPTSLADPSRAQARIEALSQRTQQAERYATQVAQQAQQHIAQLGQQNQQLYNQLTQLQAKFEAFTQYAPQAQQQPEDDLTRFQRETIEKAREAWSPELAALKRENDELRNGLTNREKAAQRQASVSRWRGQATDFVTKSFVPVLPETDAKDLSPFLEELTLAYAYGHRGEFNSIEEAGNALMRQLNRFVLARASKFKSGLKPGAQTAAKAITGKAAVSTGGRSVPTQQEAREAGSKNSLDAMLQRDGIIRAG